MNPNAKSIEEFEAAGWLDKDGLLVPIKWRMRPDNWEQFPYRMRKERSDEFIAAQSAPPPKAKVSRVYAPQFSTRAAKAWGRKQGWKLIDEENSTLTKVGKKYIRRTHDLMLGMDLMFEDPNSSGLVLVQAAGKSERKPHYERFLERGGVPSAKKRCCRVVYVEFVRNQEAPVLVEWWVA